ncbi:putative acetyl-CoA carboxylase [Trypanosoma theileri]|uniref:Putative acetyl-CoA carboxylase n=1 Tax=Trypanosoma theileri TaxID=67003 RepID=A0A1X0NIK5_9TRYP|nr:putative acetyl-CoA carboxylase [Trypanosoma theileri]ORC84477.1 putative acetyl-CoA carboxylase [Trypanosoma theileri]
MSTERKVSAQQQSFRDLSEFRMFLGGTKTIERLLIANNGLAAVKGIDSIRSWLYEHIGDPGAIEFAVMATPEDLRANAEFISLADRNVPVPGGPNSNNYANVDLIMHTALQNACDAIYPGWGHASENPALPRECAKTNNKVTFLGPSEDAMFALGDKIASTIVAQSNGVPTVPWSGDEIRLPPCVYEVDPQVYERAYVTTPEECAEVCARIGFPVMIKASEGGGGKGIRRCLRMEDVRDLFFAVAEEVKGCHIFVMRLLENVRHLEVQLLADDYGDCIAVHTRDCSVQRRHQKIIEEGPVFGVDPAIIADMEASAIRLARAVGYRGLGTVEYMYDKTTHSYYFLELNPRIQVEHPVSEMISGVNLPAALLCVGMGVPLYRVPEVRSFFGERPYETTPIDFAQRRGLPAKGHTIAVRVTAEDTNEGFRPTSGRVEEITFKNSKECWGYFSVGPGGEIHQFADSQFGHIFSSGETREDARRGMVMALRNLVIRGEIHTSVSYVVELLEREEFRNCDISTAWLDRLIAERALQGPVQQDVHLALIAASTFRMLRNHEENIAKYTAFLSAGHVPSSEYLNNCQTESYINRSRKYIVTMGLKSPTEVALSLNGSIVTVPFRKLKSGALQLTIAGKTVIAYAEKEPTSLRISIGGKETTFTGDIDPTKVSSSVPGRFVRYVVGDGGHVSEGTTIAEVEVMKMILPLRATTAGVLHHRVVPGSTIAVGTLIGDITPDDPSKVARPQEAQEQWPQSVLTDKEKKKERPDGLTRARRGVEALWNMLHGYHFPASLLDKRLQSAFDNLSSLCLSNVSLAALNLPYLSSIVETSGDTPNEKLKAVVNFLVSEYLTVEKPFVRCSRQEAIQILREKMDDPKAVYAVDFAHHQPCHHGVIKALLASLESNMILIKSLQDTLTSILNVNSSTNGDLALQARYLLRQCSLPSFSERKAAFAKELESGSIKDLIQGSYGTDLMCSIIFDRHVPHLVQLCLELYIQRDHFGESQVRILDIFPQDGCWYGFYEYEPLEDHDPLRVENISFDTAFIDDARERTGIGFCMMFPDEQVMRSTWTTALNSVMHQSPREPFVCTVFFSVSFQSTESEAARLCQQLLEEHTESLAQHKSLLRITFIVHGVSGGPHTFTYRQSAAWREDTLIRNIAPLSARRLELQRLVNYDVSMYPTPFKDVHVFRATPKKKNASFLESRTFARVFVSPRDLGVDPWTEANEIDAGHMLSKCLGALEFARNDNTLNYTMYNHVFIKMAELTFDVCGMKRLLEHVGKSYAQRLSYLGVAEVELSFHVKVSSGYIPFRVIISSPSGYGVVMRTCYEWFENGKIFLRRAENSEDVSLTVAHMSCDNISEAVAESSQSDISCTTANNNTNNGGTMNFTNNIMRTVSKLVALRSLLPSRASLQESTMETSDEVYDSVQLGPYPLLSEKQVKRLQAKTLHTVYVHDWPILLDTVLRKEWERHARARHIPRDRIPSKVVMATELFLDAADGKSLREEKQPGHVPCGMVVWIVTLLPPSYYNGKEEKVGSRRIVMVSNDITFQSGSFAVPEDAVFQAASELARRLRIPFVYMSANSGARLGLCAEVKKRFRVAFSATDEVEYLYLLSDDYEELMRMGVELEVERTEYHHDPQEKQQNGNNKGGETRYIIRGIVGAPSEYLGVENLCGSGLIAGHMSKNYSEVPTISIVSGRSVGIGAYLNRIGRRVIQTNDSPLILTGVGALNRILGKEVYSDNSQLGGRQVMVPNGVTHWNTKNNYDSAEKLLRWLDYIPPVVDPLRCNPRLLTLPHHDPIDRDVTFMPAENEAYDPRHLVCGVGDKLGLFDRGSWMESLEGWAKSVVTGRATLGGIPCGVILVETRLTRKLNPADPADPTSVSSFIAQAGQVWFPDSARKTADSLDDFHRERLPCFILANWRGFSGGMRDMFDEVLKFGASIVDNLRVYNSPVFIYIPPHGELRGGAWVVVDPVINHNGSVEMYCDPTARGGVLEPSGVVEIKFREKDIRELIRRNNPEFSTLDSKKLRDEENRLLPYYRDVANRFADLHDNYIRMQAKGVVRDVIPWKDSRRIFYTKLQRKLKELSLASSLVEAKKVESLMEGVQKIEESFAQDYPDIRWGSNDTLHLQWLKEKEEEKAFFANGTSVLPVVDKIESFMAECKAAGKLDNCFQRLFEDEELRNAAMRAMQKSKNESLEKDEFSLDQER